MGLAVAKRDDRFAFPGTAGDGHLYIKFGRALSLSLLPTTL